MRADPRALWKALAQAQRDRSPDEPPSGFQVFNRAADEMTRVLAERSSGDDARYEEGGDWRGPRVSVTRPSCSECGASNLEHFFSLQAVGATLCVPCFRRRHRAAP